MDGPDYEHLMECVDPHCWYCRDEPKPVSDDQRVLARLAARAELWDLGVLPADHPFKQAA